MDRVKSMDSDFIAVHVHKDSMHLPIGRNDEEEKKTLSKFPKDFFYVNALFMYVALWMLMDYYVIYISDLSLLSNHQNEQNHQSIINQTIWKILCTGVFTSMSFLYFLILALRYSTKFAIYIFYVIVSAITVFLIALDYTILGDFHILVKIVSIGHLIFITTFTINVLRESDVIVLILRETCRAILASKWTLIFPLLKNIFIWCIFAFGICVVKLLESNKNIHLYAPLYTVFELLNLVGILWLSGWINGLFEMVMSGILTGWYEAYYINMKREKSYGYYIWTTMIWNAGTASIGGLLSYGMFTFNQIVIPILALFSAPFSCLKPSVYLKMYDFFVVNPLSMNEAYIVSSNYKTSLRESYKLGASNEHWKMIRFANVTFLSRTVFVYAAFIVFAISLIPTITYYILYGQRDESLYPIYFFLVSLTVFYSETLISALNCIMFSAAENMNQNRMPPNYMSVILINACRDKEDRIFTDPIIV